MFSGFQSNAFQTGFQIARSGITPTPTPDTRGGIDERDYHRYRRHLEKVMEVTQEADKRKYIRTIKEDVEVITELPVETEEIDKILEGPQVKGKLKLTPDIDFEQLSVELLLIQKYLEEQLKQIQLLREQDDEAAFLLLLN